MSSCVCDDDEGGVGVILVGFYYFLVQSSVVWICISRGFFATRWPIFLLVVNGFLFLLELMVDDYHVYGHNFFSPHGVLIIVSTI